MITETQRLPYTEDMKVLFEEMTLVQVLSEEYARIEAVCVGTGLNNIESWLDGPMILIPNAGDLAVNGANVAIEFNPDGKITFTPRVQGQRKFPKDMPFSRATFTPGCRDNAFNFRWMWGLR